MEGLCAAVRNDKVAAIFRMYNGANQTDGATAGVRHFHLVPGYRQQQYKGSIKREGVDEIFDS